MVERLQLDSDDTVVRRSKYCGTWKWCWWSPPPEALVAEFCNETSLHGLQYIGQPKRHITERVFWFFAFVVGVVAAGVLIHQMFQRNEETPVIVSFQSKEQSIETIPFPSVTFCNINQISKRKVLELERIAELPEHEHYQDAIVNLTMIRLFCDEQKTFTEKNGFGILRSLPTILNEKANMLNFLAENTVSCEEMIRICNFIDGSIDQNCIQEFKPVIRENGKCCTFNMLPLSLIYRNLSFGKSLDWNDQDISKWSDWNYDQTFILPPIYDKQPEKILRPHRQAGSGKPYGLSLLLDFNTEDYYCPILNSQGLMFTLNTPLEIPHVTEFPSVLGQNKEIFINVHPDITFADPDIRDLSSESRQCYFGKEKKLERFVPYTRTNCFDDCISKLVADKCKCAIFHMPRDDGIPDCNLRNTQNLLCYQLYYLNSKSYFKHHNCGHCLPLCEDITYRFEETATVLQNASTLWYNKYVGGSMPEWANHSLSIVHVFFGSDSVIPKLRKRLYGTTDLIANVGGILGLCLGFSALSAAELIYFVSVRALWKHYNRRSETM